MSLFSNKDKKIKNPTIKIEENVITYENSFTCIDNISLITISHIPSNKTWIIALIGIFIGIYIHVNQIIVIGIIWIIGVIIYNLNRGNNLAINLNSGVSLYFHCKDITFLKRVVNLLIEKINNKTKGNIDINFQSCTINNSNILNNSSIKS